MEGGALTQRVAAGGFDSGDLGSEVCEEFAGVDGSVIGEVDDSDVGERTGLGVGHG